MVSTPFLFQKVGHTHFVHITNVCWHLHKLFRRRATIVHYLPTQNPTNTASFLRLRFPEQALRKSKPIALPYAHNGSDNTTCLP